jgi:hypothetical protein
VISPTQLPLPDNTQHSQETSILQAEFEPAIPASERPQTYAVDRAATATGIIDNLQTIIFYLLPEDQTQKP